MPPNPHSPDRPSAARPTTVQPPIRRERRPTSSELALWQTVMGVLPPAPVPEPPVAEKALATPSPRPPASSVAHAPSPAPVLEPRLSTRLKRGRTAIEGRLDLHGLTQEDAHRVLARFLGQSAEAGRRLVLVITGKGGERDGRPGILQRSVPRWLAETPNRALVGSFAPAHPRDGGSGALYVVLRRRRAH